MSSQVANITTIPDPLQGAVEIIEDHLYFIALRSQPRSDLKSSSGKPIHFFNIDSELVYWNFFLDFGPLNLGQLYRFCVKLNQKLQTLSNHCIVFYTSTVPAKRANGIYLICSWQLLYLGRSPEEAHAGFVRDGTLTTTKNSSQPPKVPSATICALPPWHDASPSTCTYELTIMDCLRGLSLAHWYKFFDFDTFNVEEYEHFEQVENGDLNWIIKDKILAFAGPQFKRNVSPEGYCTLSPQEYIPYFKKKNVALVVRLNKKCYHEKEFIDVGISHVEHYYLDGSCPPMGILNKVISAFEACPTDKAFAVHCKAGLGRTGTCIGAYIMKHYKFTAAEVIAWMRICRPGMVIGPQQQFLQDIEQRMWHEGNAMTLKPTQDAKLVRSRDTKFQDGSPKSVITASPLHFGSSTRMDYPLSNRETESVTGRPGQADGLLAARRTQVTRTSSRRLFQYT